MNKLLPNLRAVFNNRRMDIADTEMVTLHIQGDLYREIYDYVNVRTHSPEGVALVEAAQSILSGIDYLKETPSARNSVCAPPTYNEVSALRMAIAAFDKTEVK